jgi:hypothetical protein
MRSGRAQCKPCVASYNRAYHEANRERRSEQRRQYREANGERIAAQQRQYREANGDRLRAYDREYRAANLEQRRAYDREYTAANRERAAERHGEWFAGLRAAVFGHYGAACACCGSAEMLTIDHVNGDGDEHRQELFGHRPAFDGRTASTASFYLWLVNQGFPEGFQVLCRPCNGSKGTGDRCRLHQPEVCHQ